MKSGVYFRCPFRSPSSRGSTRSAPAIIWQRFCVSTLFIAHQLVPRLRFQRRVRSHAGLQRPLGRQILEKPCRTHSKWLEKTHLLITDADNRQSIAEGGKLHLAGLQPQSSSRNWIRRPPLLGPVVASASMAASPLDEGSTIHVPSLSTPILKVL